jgi:DNA polymerase III subunit delta
LKLTTDALSTHLEQQLLRVYLISGDDPLLTGEAADAIRAGARAKGFTERDVHFLERGSDWDDIRASSANMSLFGSRRVVEIRMPTGKPGVAGSAALVAMLGIEDRDTVYLILTPRLDRDAQGSAWVKAVEANGAWVQVWPVDSDRLVAWLRGRARRMGLDITNDGFEVLAERTEGNLLAAYQELQKLELVGQPGKITADTILGSVGDSARFDVFQLGESVLAGDTERALRMLAGLHAEGVEATLVLWSLTKAVRDLWGSATAAPGARPRVWGKQAAALEKGARRAPRLPYSTLTIRAARADRMIKGRLFGDAWDEMALLAADICGNPALRAPRSVLK